ncbi:TetR/AcrR family transcriptional regulator [Psychrobacillus sp.]|uniref:TetR/AcrR family transcriptional regulator n=1 Tax=Psychrobacillus sp. TaxID=1871623 RepID=UPI0028BEBB86|nr:TetR/AcrR family transcriptional regulator [Psychrobacillus sp.]
MDRRVVKTRKEIRNALLSLMEEKDFEVITVLDITKRANINRGTFYLHYVDKYEMLEKYEQELFEKLEHVAMEYLQDDDTMDKFLHSRYPAIVHVFHLLQEEQELLTILLKTRGFFSFQDRIKNTFIYMFRNNIPFKVSEHPFLYPIEFLALFASAMFISVIQYWIQSDMKQTPEQLAQMVWDIFLKGPMGAFGVLPFTE